MSSAIEALMAELEEKNRIIERLSNATVRWTIDSPCFLLKSERPFYIAGYASVDIIDNQNERITLSALRDAFERWKKADPAYHNLMLLHSNIQIGKVLFEPVEIHGKTYQTKVDDKGLFIVAEIRDDIKRGREAIEKMKRGELLSLSLGGEALERRLVLENGELYLEIPKLDIHEVTVCERGVNPAAKAFILKSLDDGSLDLDANFKANLKKSLSEVESSMSESQPTPQPEVKAEEEKAKKPKKEEEEEVCKEDALAEVSKKLDQILEILAAKKPKYYYYYKYPKKKGEEAEKAETKAEEVEEAPLTEEALSEIVEKAIEKKLASFEVIKKSPVPSIGRNVEELTPISDEELAKMSWQELEAFVAKHGPYGLVRKKEVK